MPTSGRQFEHLSYVPLSSVAIEGESKGLGFTATRCAPLVQVPASPTITDEYQSRAVQRHLLGVPAGYGTIVGHGDGVTHQAEAQAVG